MLLEKFFLNDGERERQTVFGQAFGGRAHNPAREIEWGGSAAVFASHAVDALLSFGSADRGKHALSLLLETMAAFRGRQTHPDYSDLPPLLDASCGLPTRAEELQYLRRLIAAIQELANRYSPLGSSRRKTGHGPKNPLPLGLEHDPSFEVLRHRRRQRILLEPESQVEVRDYSDTRTAFQEVSQAILLGAPGSGKSTTLRKHSLELANRAQGDARSPIPLLVSLGNWTDETPFQEFLAKQIPEIGWAVEALGKAKRLVVLLDGLNEMPTALRAAKTQQIAGFMKYQLPAETPVVISCRVEDYEPHPQLHFDTLTLEPLTPQRIRAAARMWVESRGESAEVADRFFWELAGDQRLAEVLACWSKAGLEEESFWRIPEPVGWDYDLVGKVGRDHYKLWRQHRSDPRSLLDLASNPFMFTMLFMIWWESRGALPRNRSDLFSGFVDELLHREHLMEKPPGSKEWRRTADGQRLVAGLQDLAWAMQRTRIEAGPSESGDFGVLTVVSSESAIAALGDPTLPKKAVDSTFLDGAAELRFRHQLLQEYFTALALAQKMATMRAEELWPVERWWERSGWEEVAVLLAGFYSEDCTEVIRWVRDAQPEVASKCYLESGAEVLDKAGLLRELQEAWMPCLTDPGCETQPEGRAAVGRALGRLGLDDREGVGVSDGEPDIDWVRIEGGAFACQDGERRIIETFYIARYPVTNAQYQAFLDAPDGYQNDLWWKGLSNPKRNPKPPRWSEPNHPRETVSWHEAMAFCSWLSARVGYSVTLPTEWQWERAARGRDGRAFPCGDEYRSGRANIDETWNKAGPHRLGRTSPVGIYPMGAPPSPEDIKDLAGNVWEWCLNEFKKPKSVQRGGENLRVLRGGSWGGVVGSLTAFRFASLPGSRRPNFGFRVVCSSPSTGH